MRIWRVTAFHDQHGTMYSWCRNKRDAEKEATRIRRENGDEVHNVEGEPMDIPTDKAGLVKWLNLYLQLDNG